MKYIDSERLADDTPVVDLNYVEAETLPDGRTLPVVELSRHNLEVLLAKLDDPQSLCTIVDGNERIAVRAVENTEHYTDRAPGRMLMPSTGKIV